MAFWQHQVDELLTGISALGGFDMSLGAATTPPLSTAQVPTSSADVNFTAQPSGGSAADGSWSSKGSEAADDAVSSLRQARAARDEADRALYAMVSDAHAVAAASRARLQRIHDEITAGVARLQPSMDTPAGREHMADFLEAKAQQARDAVDEANSHADRIASSLAAQFGI